MSMGRRCEDCGALPSNAHDATCEDGIPYASRPSTLLAKTEKAVERKLYDLICLGGGDGDTLKEFAREIVAIVRNSKETV